MSKGNTFGELLNKRSSNPLNIDTSEIRSLSEAMPKDGNIDLNNAEIMATKFLRGADLCGELLSVAVAYVANTKDAKQRAYNEAFLVKSSESGLNIKTDKMRIAFAELDEDYQHACNEHNKAIAFHKWIESKHNSFIRFHYLSKKVLERRLEEQKNGNWIGSYDDSEDKDDW